MNKTTINVTSIPTINVTPNQFVNAIVDFLTTKKSDVIEALENAENDDTKLDELRDELYYYLFD